uniref:26S proteasome regulatory subunit RPN2 n=1 Tax=Percolomonas cosmopolitus TaxID=63605 RepID=A0A7S1PI52_9EUKA
MASLLALLREDNLKLQQVAIQKLNTIVDTEWPHLADDIELLEGLATSEDFTEQKLASLITSKVYFHLGEYNEALNFALGAGDAFLISNRADTYVDKIIERCIDNYIEQRIKHEDEDNSVQIDSRLEAIVNKMFDRCFDDGKFKQALGIALETRRLDIAKKSILHSNNVSKMLAYCVDVANNLIASREFRSRVLRMLADLFADESLKHEERNYYGQAECYLFLDDWRQVLDILNTLIKSSEDDTLIAYQIAFDLHDRASQHFIQNIAKSLNPPQEKTKPVTNLEDVDDDVAMTDVSDLPQDEQSPIYTERKANLLRILDGTVAIEYNLDFLLRRNKADMEILNNIKNSFDKSSILHNATIVSNSFMHAGTCVDRFLRDNLEWLSQATNWAKFTATASMGVIHKGDYKRSREVLAPYLPKMENPGATSVYSEGGALYALGLIHSSHGGEMTDYLTNWVEKEADLDHNIMHGACLGLGLTAMASERDDLFEKLSGVCYLDNAVSAEAAAIAMGLVMLGSGNDSAFDEMHAYAHETPHEKVIRGLSLGMALIMYGREEGADVSIEKMLNDKDPIIRYGAMYAIGMAYCGTGNNNAVQKLLKIGVSDVSDDVRRAAVMNLGFVLCKTPKQVPRLLNLLAKSYNPHVRYGVAMALGIACAGTGLKDAVDILEELVNDEDEVDYVQQGAYMALAMVLMQLNEKSVDENGEKMGEKTKQTRDTFEKVYKGRNLIMKKMGAVVASGIIDAGGRNVTISMHKNGHNKMRNIVGLMMFTQYWFWYPYLHFLSLAFEPTAIIGLNKDLKMPEFKFKSNAPPSLFAYPEKVQTKEKEKKKIGPAAALSITKKKQREEKRKKNESGEVSPLTPFTPNTAITDTPLPASTVKHSRDEGKMEDVDQEKKKKDEPEFEILENPARVTLMQLKHITFDVDEDRYQPLKKRPELGFTLLKHLKAGETEKLVELKESSSGAIDENEPAPPETFEWDDREEDLELPTSTTEA